MTPYVSIFGKIPFLRYSIAFILGSIIAEAIDYNSFYVISIFIFLCFFLFQKIKWAGKSLHYNKIYSLISAILFVISGFVYSSIYQQNQYTQNLPLKAKFVGTIIEKSPTSTNRVKYLVKLNAVSKNNTTSISNEKILLYYSDSLINSQLKPGSKIVFEDKLFEITCNNNPGEFNYKKFMNHRGIRYQSYVYSEILILNDKSHSIKTSALNIRSKLLSKYKQAGIENQEFAVLAALTLGEKNYLDYELKSSFSSSGAMHVLAVSGLHVGIIYFVFNFLLLPLKKHKYARFIKVLILLFILWGYAFISGLSPSVLRACTMFSFIVIGENLKRKTNIYNTLALSAFLLMLINPLIIYEVGFQLSYAAVTSIVFFQPRIASLIKVKNKILKYLWGLLTVSIAAQIGTFPISIYYFHQFPVYFLISNFIVIPAAAILLYLALVFFLTQLLPSLSFLIALVLNFFTRTMNQSIQAIEQLPGSVIEQIWIDRCTMFLIFAIIIMFGWIIINPKFKLLLSVITFSVLLTGNAIKNKIQVQKQNVILFYNTYNNGLISFINGKEHFYYSCSDSIDKYTISIITNASGKFHTNEALLIKKNENVSNNLKIYNNYIFYKNISIQINTAINPNQNKLFENEIIWIPDKSKIFIKKWEKFTPQILKKGNFKSFKPHTNESKFINNDEATVLLHM